MIGLMRTAPQPVRLVHDPLRDVIEVLERYAATGARTLVLSADSGLAGYDTRPSLDEQPC
jgi:hypothetical protein